MANILQVPYDSKDTWPIKEVRLYEDRAQVSRFLDYKPTDAGEVELKLQSLPLNITKESIRAEVTTGNASIFEVTSKQVTSYPKTKPTHYDRVKEINEEITKIHQQNAKLNKRLQWFNNYSNKIVPTSVNSNINKKGNQVFDALVGDQNLGNLKGALEFFAKEATDLDLQLLENNFKVNELSEERRKLETEWNKIRNEETKTSLEVTVLITVPDALLEDENPGVISVKLDYVVRQCKWDPKYDIRVDKAGGVVDITYMGNITNNTGEDWFDVVLSLSTAKPSRAGNLPILKRAEARLQNGAGGLVGSAPGTTLNQISNDVRARNVSMTSEMDMDLEEFDDGDANDVDDFVQAQDATTEQTGGAAQFKLNRLCSIETDNKPHRQTIGRFKLKPTFTYVVSPQVSPSCYLRCSAKNDSGFVLIPGPMAIFFNESFVTTSRMKMVNQKETFSVYLGIEETVKVDYQPLLTKNEKAKGGLLTAKTKQQTSKRTINIINTRNEPISCVLYEQVPLAKNEKIKVTVTSPDLSKKKGKETYKINKLNHLECKKTVGKGKTWSVQFDYKVEWPKDKEIEFKESKENIRQY